jgi:MFS family permease
VPARASLIVSCIGLISGSLLTLAALQTGDVEQLLGGLVVQGVGFGAGFDGAVRYVMDAADVVERAATLSAILIVLYVSISVPTIAAGFLTGSIGLLNAARWSAVFVCSLSFCVLVMQVLGRGSRDGDPYRSRRA